MHVGDVELQGYALQFICHQAAFNAWVWVDVDVNLAVVGYRYALLKSSGIDTPFW